MNKLVAKLNFLKLMFCRTRIKIEDNHNTFSFSALSEQEKEFVINEIYERWKDMVYMNAKDHIRDIFEHRPVLRVISTADQINLSLNINLVVGDIIQLLGRYRRKKASEEMIRLVQSLRINI